MAPRITVIGATGKQGGSVVDTFLKDGNLQVRALTRNTDSPKAQALAKQGAEVVQANFDDLDSLRKAFANSDTIFAMTDFFAHFFTKSAEEAQSLEYEQGKKIALAASQTPNLKNFIWSTLPDTKANSGGAIIVPHFQGKADVDHFIRKELTDTLFPKTTFLYVTNYVDNFLYPPFQPVYMPALDKYLLLQPHNKSSQLPLLGDAQVNTGPFVLGIVKNSELAKGRTVLGTLGFETAEYVAKSLAKQLEKEVVYTKVDLETFESVFPKWGTEIGSNLVYFDHIKGPAGWGSSGNKDVDPLLPADLGLEIGKDLETWDAGMARMEWKAKFAGSQK